MGLSRVEIPGAIERFDAFARDSKIQVGIPRSAQAAVSSVLPRASASFERPPEMIIRMRDVRLPVRGLSAYLALLDRVYGRLSYGSLERYARKRSGHVQITEVRRGSLILVVKEILETVLSPHGLIFTGLVLKFLPEIIKAPAAAYRDYEEARHKRAQRKLLTETACDNPRLRKLNPRQLGQILSVVLRVYEKEQTRLKSAQEFARDAVEDVHVEGFDD